MKLHVLYSIGSPADRDVDNLQRELAGRNVAPEILDADSREGIALAELYDAMGRPAVIATTDDGVLLKKWEGMVPAVSEVSMYVPGF